MQRSEMPKRTNTKNPHARKQRRTTVKRTNAATAFPAPVQAPGQPKSHEAFEAFEKKHDSAYWWADYVQLRNEGISWRVAAYIAWASSPLKRRWPATLKELATQVLGLRSDKVIYKWRKMSPAIDERVEMFRAEPLLRYRSDVLHALVDVASTADPSAHADRKLYLEIVGDYRPRSSTTIETWQDRVIGLLRANKITPDELIKELGNDVATDLLISAGLPVGEGGGAGAPGGRPDIGV